MAFCVSAPEPDPTRIVTVSDRRKKKNQPDKGLSEKDQSLHIFEIPS
jgi:hypothetical protein